MALLLLKAGEREKQVQDTSSNCSRVFREPDGRPCFKTHKYMNLMLYYKLTVSLKRIKASSTSITYFV